MQGGLKTVLCGRPVLCYYSISMDGSTDSSFVEQELIYVLFINNGTLQVKFFSVESVKSVDAKGLLSSLK